MDCSGGGAAGDGPALDRAGGGFGDVVAIAVDLERALFECDAEHGWTGSNADGALVGQMTGEVIVAVEDVDFRLGDAAGLGPAERGDFGGLQDRVELGAALEG